MPIYLFTCECGGNKKLLLKNPTVSVYCDDCEKKMKYSYGKPMVREMITGDEYRNKKMVAGVEKMLEKRSTEHFAKTKLNEIIEEEGIDYAKANGFVDHDGRANK